MTVGLSVFLQFLQNKKGGGQCTPPPLSSRSAFRGCTPGPPLPRSVPPHLSRAECPCPCPCPGARCSSLLFSSLASASMRFTISSSRSLILRRAPRDSSPPVTAGRGWSVRGGCLVSGPGWLRPQPPSCLPRKSRGQGREPAAPVTCRAGASLLCGTGKISNLSGPQFGLSRIEL